MASRGQRRQILLFLVAVLLPCSVLVALGLRMIGQERELGEKRLADERRFVTNQIRLELSARLDRISSEEIARLAAAPQQIQSPQYSDSVVVLVASLVNGDLVLPWQSDPRAERARRLLAQEPFARHVRQGERAELAERQWLDAITSYEHALSTARDPTQQLYARLLLGRAASKLQHGPESIRHYQAVLQSTSDITDDLGVTLWSYAAARLLEAGVAHRRVLQRMDAALAPDEWLSPSQLYLFRALADTVTSCAADTMLAIEADQLSAAIAARIVRVEQLLALKQSIASLPISTDPSSGNVNPWVLWEEANWLVGVGSPAGAATATVVAVRAAGVFASLEVTTASPIAGRASLVVGSEADGELLGGEFPGLEVQFAAAPEGSLGESWSLRRWFYLLTVLLVVSATLFGAYLLGRDVQRDLRMAEMRSRFVSSVSHELKTPLTAIRMFAETLRLRAAAPETQAEYLDTIVNESERLTRLLNNVLDFTKIEHGTKIYRRERQDLAEIVQSTVRAMRYLLEQRQFALRVTVDDGIPHVMVDRDAIEQAILNLLANAVKYSGESRDIELRLRAEDGRAVIEVADHGAGIEPAAQRSIFEQFYRAPTADNQSIPGTGLGLTLVDHIAKGHGGRVTVESEPGVGSTFSICLPLDQGPT
jgi:signal transduction histidine kinase